MTGDWQLAKTEEAVSASRTPGQRALIVHIKKGHSLKRVANSASVEVGVQYGDVQVATLPVDASAPVWNDTFVIPENVYVAGNALNFRLTARTTNGCASSPRCLQHEAELRQRVPCASTVPARPVRERNQPGSWQMRGWLCVCVSGSPGYTTSIL